LWFLGAGSVLSADFVEMIHPEAGTDRGVKCSNYQRFIGGLKSSPAENSQKIAKKCLHLIPNLCNISLLSVFWDEAIGCRPGQGGSLPRTMPDNRATDSQAAWQTGSGRSPQ
jgi:hypothetical protein